MKLINIVGARPNFIKIAPLMFELKNHINKIDYKLIHTGQHYDIKMSQLFFDELKIPKPDINLEVGSDTQAKQVAKIMEKFDDVTEELKPDVILVAGDVNSTLACSLVAAKKQIKIIHLEAGLRSYDRSMPEEINRIVTDTLADLLLAPSIDAVENLLKEGINKDKIKLVGNIMIDSLFMFKSFYDKSDVLQKFNLLPQRFGLITLHRPSNVDDKLQLKRILESLDTLSKNIKIIFPVHPRTMKNIENFNLKDYLKDNNNLIITDPLGYIDFQALMINSKFVITDSGGVQEETTALKIPCITLRKNTERPITITEGTNVIVGDDLELMYKLANDAINNKWKNSKVPVFWDGNTSKRVINAIYEAFEIL